MSSNVTEIHGNQQHYRVTLEEAIAHYKNRDLTAKGLLHFYVKIRCRPGWLFRKTQKALCAELGMSRTTFLDALAKLQAEGVIDCSVPDSTEFTIRLNGTDSKDELDGKPSDYRKTVKGDGKPSDYRKTVKGDGKPSDYRKTVKGDGKPSDYRKTVKGDGKPSKQRPEALPAKDSTTPSYSSHSSYQIFLKSLSEEERERFLNFQKRKAKKLPEYPSSKGWFANNYEHHAEEWRESEGKAAPAASQDAKWENDPRRQEWLAEVASLRCWGKFTDLAGSNHTEMVERGAFYDWVEANEIVPGLKQPKKFST